MSRNISIFSVVVVMIVTLMATVAVAFATSNKGDSAQENGQGNSEEKDTICYKGHTITVGASAVEAQYENDRDTVGTTCPVGPVPGPTTPTLTTLATAEVTLGEPISDTATLSGATSDATGDITFKLYGPFDASTLPSDDTCIDPDPNADPPVAGNLVTTLGPFDIGDPDGNDNYVVSSGDYDPDPPLAVGRYQWVASYSGDDNNDPLTSPCNAPNEQSVVAEANTTTATEQLTTSALDHKKQRLLVIKEKLRADETPQEQKEALRERRKQLREVIYG